jgi:subtilase family serine protease
MKIYSKIISAFLATTPFLFIFPLPTQAAYHFADYRAHSPLRIYATTKTAVGVTPDEIKSIYGLPSTGGKGTIAIVSAYNNTAIEKDLADFNAQFGLSSCTTKNHCFKKHLMSSKVKSDNNWALETALDVEWAHAIAPTAKILLVEAVTPSGANLMKAVDYAAKQKGVIAVSMSWGGAEFPEEVALDSHFGSKYGATFFASSGDSGTGASWPAASPNVIGVGGTSLLLAQNSSLIKEKAWQGSGGGVSAYEAAPQFQTDYTIPKSNGMRAIPDVAYDADPASGFPIVHAGVWHTAGGTSAGAPQWAAISTLGSGVQASMLYADKASDQNALYFRDVTSGSNGSCGYYCKARSRYDYITGLGVPQTVNF